jgi:acylphosphatase
MKMLKEKIKSNQKASIRRFRVTGLVQGVNFRKNVQLLSIGLGLKGWVRNEADGSVLMEVYGKEFEIQELKNKMLEGLGNAIVYQVIEEPPVAHHYEHFEIIA